MYIYVHLKYPFLQSNVLTTNKVKQCLLITFFITFPHSRICFSKFWKLWKKSQLECNRWVDDRQTVTCHLKRLLLRHCGKESINQLFCINNSYYTDGRTLKMTAWPLSYKLSLMHQSGSAHFYARVTVSRRVVITCLLTFIKPDADFPPPYDWP